MSLNTVWEGGVFAVPKIDKLFTMYSMYLSCQSMKVADDSILIMKVADNSILIMKIFYWK